MVALVAAPAATLAAEPTFDKPIVVRGTSARTVGNPSVALSSTGRLAVAFTDAAARRGGGFQVVVRRGGLDGRLGRREVLASTGYEPVVGVDGRGTPAVVWEEMKADGGRTLRARVAAGPSGKFGPAQVLASGQGIITSWTVLDNGGRFVAVWQESVPGSTSKRAARYAIASKDGRFGRAQTLAPETGPLSGVAAGRAPDGTIVAAWGTPLSFSPPVNQQLAEATLAPGAPAFTPGPGQRAVRVTQGAEIAGIGVAQSAGGAALTWQEQGSLPQLLRTAAPGGAASTVATSESKDLGARSLRGPALAIPATGARSALWADVQGPGGESEQTTGGQVLTATQAADGSWSAPVTLSGPGEIATQPGAGASRSLSAYLWTTGSFPRFGLRYAVRSASGAVTAARTLAAGAARPPAIASSGPAVVAAWIQRDPRAPRGSDAQNHASIRLSVLRDR